MNTYNILLAFFAGWFAISIVAVLLENILLLIFLKKSGAKLLFVMSGTPGYLDMIYKKWCKENQLRPEQRLRLRRILLINVVLAILAFFLFASFILKKN